MKSLAFGRCFSRLMVTVTLAAGAFVIRSFAAEGAEATPAPGAVAPGKNTSRTVGVDIVKRTQNPDNTTSLLFRWAEKDKQVERTVVVNEQTIVVYDGELKKFSEITDDQFRTKAVATVGEDGVTTRLLRFGRKPLPKDKLTPEQLAIVAQLAPPPTAASDAALDKRVDGIVQSLELKDAAQRESLRAVLAADLRAIREAHNAGLQLDPGVHQAFLSGLQTNLTPEQVESVKDKLTVNKVPITFRVYHEIIPGLTPQDDEQILALLKKAREQSLQVKNVDEMTPIFKKYKTEIEHYLNAQGYDWAKSYQAFVAAQKSH